MWKPCIECGVPSPGTRCPTHQHAVDLRVQAKQTARRKQVGGRSKYGGQYQGGARAVRDFATQCWLCGGGPERDDPWQADHIEQGTRAGTQGGPVTLAAAHRSCNIRRRHLSAKGIPHERIVERLRLLRHGPARTGEAGTLPPGQLPAGGSAK